MICARILDGDSLFRHSVHPVSFRGKAFSHEKLLTLYQEDERLISASVTWERFLPALIHVHEYGCRMALKRNSRKKTERKYREKDRQIYCGAYEIKAKTIRDLAKTEGLYEIASADVTHQVEDGELAHSNVRIILNTGQINVESTKTAILDRLWHGTRGPISHVCEYDVDVKAHPSLGLGPAPGGEYIPRSLILKFFYGIRFWICEWIEHRFGSTSRSVGSK